MDDNMQVASVEDSILNSVKKVIGILPDQTEFNVDILIFINSAISILTQLGVGPEEGFTVTDDTTTYEDFLGPNSKETNMVKAYLAHHVRMNFDPPQSSIVSQAILASIKELECRLNMQVDPRDTFDKGVTFQNE